MTHRIRRLWLLKLEALETLYYSIALINECRQIYMLDLERIQIIIHLPKRF